MSVVEHLVPEESVDIVVWGGKSLAFDLEYLNDDETPIDLTGFVARGEIRRFPDGPLLVAFTCTIADDPTTGIVTVQLSAEDTYKVRDRAVYDIQIESGEAVNGLLTGNVRLIRGVTE